VAKQWLAAREADLLPVEYYHVVFTLPAPIGAIAYHNKVVVYGVLFQAAAETLLTIAADPKHLGARIGFTMVLHTWGSALTHHPHVHCIVPGGGISLDEQRWVACRRGFFLPVRVRSRLFRRLFCEKLATAHRAGALTFFAEHAGLIDEQAFGECSHRYARSRGWSTPSVPSPDPRPYSLTSPEAYPTPTAVPADLPVSGKLIDADALLDRRQSAVGIG
jgi:hypothetical protein